MRRGASSATFLKTAIAPFLCETTFLTSQDGMKAVPGAGYTWTRKWTSSGGGMAAVGAMISADFPPDFGNREAPA